MATACHRFAPRISAIDQKTEEFDPPPRGAVAGALPGPKSSGISVRPILLDDAAMTKAENRAAAKAYHQQKMQELSDAIRNERIAADLAELDRLRNYLILKSQTNVPRKPLITAIDDYVEMLTGDRCKLHTRHHSAGCKHS